MSTILDTIVDYKRQWVQECKAQISEPELLGKAQAYAPRPFTDAMMERIDRRAALAGERVLFVPTFYAWGRVPED